MVTSNHIHLLVLERGNGEIARSMQLISGRTAQEYNRRKVRKGAFWEDRYHATAVDTGEYLARCMVYIDMNMVRAGKVSHPGDWVMSGYHEIQHPPVRYAVIDQSTLQELLEFRNQEQLRKACRVWVEDRMKSAQQIRKRDWSESVAVGKPEFIAMIQKKLGVPGKYRVATENDGVLILKEPVMSYKVAFTTKIGCLSGNNMRYTG